MHFWRDQTEIAINLHSCARGKSPARRRLAGAVQICKTESARPTSADGSASLQKLSFCKLVQAGWVSARLNVQILASQCGPARTAGCMQKLAYWPGQIGTAWQGRGYRAVQIWTAQFIRPETSIALLLFLPTCKYIFFCFGLQIPKQNRILDLKLWKWSLSSFAVCFSDSYPMFC